MEQAFKNAGGDVNFKLLPPIGDDGHMLVSEGEDAWSPILDEFLEGKGPDD
jgi:hypothetical protein